MILAGIPDLAVIIPGAFRVHVADHRVQRHLEGHRDSLFPRHHAHGGAKSAACAFSADHDMIDAQFCSVLVHISEHGKTIFHGGRVRLLPRQSVTRREDGHTILFDHISHPAHINHFLHAEKIAASVNPENADRMRGRF